MEVRSRSKSLIRRTWPQCDKLQQCPSPGKTNDSHQGIMWRLDSQHQMSPYSTPGSIALAIVQVQAQMYTVRVVWMAVYWDIFEYTANKVLRGFDPYADVKVIEKPAKASDASQRTRSEEVPGAAPPTSLSLSSYSSPYFPKGQFDSDGQKDGNGERPPKKFMTRHISSRCSQARHLLACPFHKLSPVYFSADSDLKYRSCMGPGWKSVSKMKDHLFTLHLILTRCPNCNGEFPHQAALGAHIANEPHCEARPATGRDDVNLVQLGKIDSVVSGGTNGENSTDTAKWYQIWNILFPGFDAPSDPWHTPEITMLPTTFSSKLDDQDHPEQVFVPSPSEINPGLGASHNLSHGCVFEPQPMSVTPSLSSDNSEGMSRASSLSAHETRDFRSSTLDSLDLNNNVHSISNAATGQMVRGLELSPTGMRDCRRPPPSDTNLSTSSLPVTRRLRARFLPREPEQLTSLSNEAEINQSQFSIDLDSVIAIAPKNPFVENEWLENICCAQIYNLSPPGANFNVPHGFCGLSERPQRTCEPGSQFPDYSGINLGQVHELPDSQEVSFEAGINDMNVEYTLEVEQLNQKILEKDEKNTSYSPERDDDKAQEKTLDTGLEIYSTLGLDFDSEIGEDDYEFIPETFESIESNVMDVLGPDCEYTDQLMLLLQAKWNRDNLPLSPGVVSCTTSGDSPPPSSGNGPDTSRPLAKGEAEIHSKRGFVPDSRSNSNEEDDEQRRRPKKQKPNRDPDENFAGQKFACHFHKRNPKKYCVQKGHNLSTNEQIKWRKCAGQGSSQLRHLMADLSGHKIYDCEVCLEEFGTQDQYIYHQDDKKCNSKPALQAPRRDGIDRFQWRKIQDILKVKDKDDTEKWMDIWRVIFPHTPTPNDPWASEDDDATEIPTSSRAVESVVDIVQKLVQADIKTGKITSYNESMNQRYELHIRSALHIEHRRADGRRSVATLPTPSSSSRAAYTPASDSQFSNPFGTPSHYLREIAGMDRLRSSQSAATSLHQQMSPDIVDPASGRRSPSTGMMADQADLRDEMPGSISQANAEEDSSVQGQSGTGDLSMPSPFLSTDTRDRGSTAVTPNYPTVARQLSQVSAPTPGSPVSVNQSSEAGSLSRQRMPPGSALHTPQSNDMFRTQSRMRRSFASENVPGQLSTLYPATIAQTPVREALSSNLPTSGTPERHGHQVNSWERRIKELEDVVKNMQQFNTPGVWQPFDQNSGRSQGYEPRFSESEVMHGTSYAPGSSSMAPDQNPYLQIPGPQPMQPWGQGILGDSQTRDWAPNLSQIPQQMPKHGVSPSYVFGDNTGVSGRGHQGNYTGLRNPNGGNSNAGQSNSQNSGDASNYQQGELDSTWLFPLQGSGDDGLGGNDQDDMPEYNQFGSRR